MTNPTEPQNSQGDLPEVPELPHTANLEVFKLSFKFLGYLLVALLVIGGGVAYWIDGLAGLWGALMGVGIALVFSGTTIWSMIHTADKSPNYLMGVVLGAWFAKIVFMIIVIASIRNEEFYNKPIFAVILLIGAIGSAALDILAVSKVRQPYVTPIKK